MKYAPVQQSIYHRDNKLTPSPRKSSLASSASTEKSSYARIFTSKDQQSYLSTNNNSPTETGVKQEEEVKATEPCDPCYIYYSSSVIYDLIAKSFNLEQRNTTIYQEFIAAIASFLTMSYVLLINPQILNKLGMPPQYGLVSTALCSAVGTFIVGFFGNLPVGIAPGIGLSTYLLYGLVYGNEYTLTEVFTSSFIAGVLLLILSLTGLSKVIMAFIPRSIKFATIVGMGLQITLYGMFSVNLVVSQPLTLVSIGNIYNSDVWLTFLGLIGIGTLLYHRIPGSLILGIIILTIINNTIHQTVPTEFFTIPDILEQITHQSQFIIFKGLDFDKVWTAILSLVFVGVIDVSGVLFGIASLAKIPLINNEVPGTTSTFVATSLSTLLSAFTGSSPTIVYIESVAGIKEGGRTGLTAIFISIFFIIAIFFSPILSIIPAVASAPVAILIGVMMMSESNEINWNQINEAIPAFLTIVIMPFTFSITNGIAIGLLASFIFYFTTGQAYYDLIKYFSQTSSPTTDSSGGNYVQISSTDESSSTVVDPSGEVQPLKSDLEVNNIELSSSTTAATTTSTYMYYDHHPVVRIPSLFVSHSEKEEVRRMFKRS